MYDRDEAWTNDNQPTGNNWAEIELKRQHEQRMAQQQAINNQVTGTSRSVSRGQSGRGFHLFIGLVSAIGMAVYVAGHSTSIGVILMAAAMGFFVGAGAPWLVISGVVIYLICKS